jgi:hypothetical protein
LNLSRNRYSVSLAVRAFGMREGMMEPSPQEFQDFLRGLTGSFTVEYEDAKRSLLEDAGSLKSLYEQFVYMRVVENISKNVRIDYER